MELLTTSGAAADFIQLFRGDHAAKCAAFSIHVHLLTALPACRVCFRLQLTKSSNSLEARARASSPRRRVAAQFLRTLCSHKLCTLVLPFRLQQESRFR